MSETKIAVVRTTETFPSPLTIAIDRDASKAMVLMEVRLFKSAGADQPKTMQEPIPLKVFTFNKIQQHESSEILPLQAGEYYAVVVVSAQDVGHGRDFKFDYKMNARIVGGHEGQAPAHSVPPKTKTLRAVYLFTVR